LPRRHRLRWTVILGLVSDSEVLAVTTYLSHYWPWLYSGSSLSPAGIGVAAALEALLAIVKCEPATPPRRVGAHRADLGPPGGGCGATVRTPQGGQDHGRGARCGAASGPKPISTLAAEGTQVVRASSVPTSLSRSRGAPLVIEPKINSPEGMEQATAAHHCQEKT
jgi:hypothetical protein